MFTAPLQQAHWGGNGMLATSSTSPVHLCEDLAGKDDMGTQQVCPWLDTLLTYLKSLVDS